MEQRDFEKEAHEQKLDKLKREIAYRKTPKYKFERAVSSIVDVHRSDIVRALFSDPHKLEDVHNKMMYDLNQIIKDYETETGDKVILVEYLKILKRTKDKYDMYIESVIESIARYMNKHFKIDRKVSNYEMDILSEIYAIFKRADSSSVIPEFKDIEYEFKGFYSNPFYMFSRKALGNYFNYKNPKPKYKYIIRFIDMFKSLRDSNFSYDKYIELSNQFNFVGLYLSNNPNKKMFGSTISNSGEIILHEAVHYLMHLVGAKEYDNELLVEQITTLLRIKGFPDLYNNYDPLNEITDNIEYSIVTNVNEDDDLMSQISGSNKDLYKLGELRALYIAKKLEMNPEKIEEYIVRLVRKLQ